MTQFKCKICGAEFEQKSRYERHMLTSHPEPAPSAADVEKMLAGINFPKNKKELIKYTKENSENKKAQKLIEDLPDRNYRDAAEITRALGEIKTYTKKPQYQPSKLGGKRAMETKNTPSAAKISASFEGIKLPKNKKELVEYSKKSDKETQKIIKQFPEKDYHTMADITKAIHEIKS
ncbi:MAG: DUF2795 domain-containing protein [Nanoarchaeota archaeon]